MNRKNHSENRPLEAGRSWPVALAALAIFGLLGTMPETLEALHVFPATATSSHGIKLLQAPPPAGPVPLPPIAQPVQPSLPYASVPKVNPDREASTVSVEDTRIRTLLHDAVHIDRPSVIAVPHALPTLVLPAASVPYTSADLAEDGALKWLNHDTAQLSENVFVPAGARLSLRVPALSTLYMDDTSSGFTSIVAWGGSLSFTGTQSRPLKIMGWDTVASTLAVDKGFGRPYIRELAGAMNFAHVQASALGFWSGRTGGVAWTGVSGSSSTGAASHSTFTDDTYGAFVSRGNDVKFSGDRFELNELDGLHIHRDSIGTSATLSSASRNGGSGFVVERATRKTSLLDDVSDHNGNNGYFIDGRPLVSTASASGSSTTPGTGTVIQDSSAAFNARTGILVEGGTGTVIEADRVCAKITAIAVTDGATNSVLTGNNVLCGARSGFSIGPSAPGTTVSGNAVAGPRIGMLIRDSGAIMLDDNRITGATVFGISVRGASSNATGVGDVIWGNGLRAVDTSGGASAALKFTDETGWIHHVKVTFWSYLRFHPLAALWLSTLILVIVALLWSRRRPLSPHPYPYPATMRRRADAPAVPVGEWPFPRRAQLEPALAGAPSQREQGRGPGRHQRFPPQREPELPSGPGPRLAPGQQQQFASERERRLASWRDQGPEPGREREALRVVNATRPMPHMVD